MTTPGGHAQIYTRMLFALLKAATDVGSRTVGQIYLDLRLRRVKVNMVDGNSGDVLSMFVSAGIYFIDSTATSHENTINQSSNERYRLILVGLLPHFRIS